MEPDIIVSTMVRTHEDPVKVVDSVRSIFPDWHPEDVPVQSDFPVGREGKKIFGSVESIDNLLSILRENRILDTALDAMAMEADKEGTFFRLSRQSAFIGKASFVLGADPLGGSIEVTLNGPDIIIWLEQCTWHSGRENIPREVGDELAMSSSGEASEWFGSSDRARF